MNHNKKLSKIVLAVLLAFLLVPGEMLSMAGVLPDPEPELGVAGNRAGAGAGAIEALEATWEGGGPLMLFADDMSAITAQHYADMGIEDYYGGAVPMRDDGPEAWRHEPLRWGVDRPEGSEPWRVAANPFSPEAWHFGHEGPNGLQYPLLGAQTGAVTPVIDLRSVPRVDASQDVVANVGVVPVVTGWDEFVANLLETGGIQDHGIDSHVHHESSTEVSQASAALRLRHAYSFDVSPNAEFTDGARVEFSIYHPVGGWTPWHGLDPVGNALQVGEDTIQARRVAATGHSVSADMDLHREVGVDTDALPDSETIVDQVPEPGSTPDPDPDSLAQEIPEPEEVVTAETEYQANVTWSDSNDQDVREVNYVEVAGNETERDVRSGSFNETGRPPWLYQGPVTSSDGNWPGFGGDSGGLVDSVFDLSLLAGHLVRLRMVTSVQEAGARDTLDLDGWTVDALQVTGIGEPGMDILELATPGNGAVIDPDGPDFQLAVMLHNKESQPTEAHVEFDLLDAEATTSTSTPVPIGVGPGARVLVKAPDSINELIDREGLHRVQVTVISHGVSRDDPARAHGGLISEGMFHFLFGPGGGPEGESWEASNLELVPLGDETDNNRVIRRNQAMEVRVTLSNLESNATTLSLDAEGIRPVFRDLRGTPVGEVVPTEPSILLPVSRDVSGSLGEPGAEKTVNWTWPGTPAAQVLEVFLVDGEGNVILEGGRVRVDAVEPPAVRLRTSNPWNIGDQTGDGEGSLANQCDRFLEREGRRGVVRCGPGDELVSPVRAVTPAQLGRGEDLTMQLTHKGGNFTVQFHHDPRIPLLGAQPSPLDSVWETPFANLTVESAENWTVTQDITALPSGCTQSDRRGCWIFLTFEAGSEEPWFMEEIRLEIEGVQVEWETFRVAVEPQKLELQAQGDPPIFWLHGRDQWASGMNQSFGFNLGGIDQGDLKFGQLLDNRHYPSGRIIEDSVLELEPILLDGARPVLVFDHWYALGTGGRAIMEIAPSINGLPGAWEPMVTFEGFLDLPPQMQTTRVSLEELVGEQIHVRFRHEIDPQADVLWEGWGWLLENPRVEEQGSSGYMETALVPSSNEDISSSQNYESVWPRFDAGLENGATVSRVLDEPKMHLTFHEDMNPCASSAFPNRYGRGPGIITDAVDLRAAQNPSLFLEHRGVIGHDTFANPRIVLDLEYQVMDDAGVWPSIWSRSTPHAIMRENGTNVVVPLDRDPQTGARALTDPDGNWVGEPFYMTLSRPKTETDDPPWMNEFDLSALGDEVVRFRLNAWTIPPGGQQAYGCTEGALDWNIESFTIRERNHMVDVATQDIRLDRSDAVSIQTAGGSIREADAVVANDLFNAFVTIANEGEIPLDQVLVNLHVDYLEELEEGEPGRGLNVEFVDDTGIPLGRTGFVAEVLRGTEREVRFSIDATNARPGRYQLTVVSEPVGDVDTNPENDAQRFVLLVGGFRNLDVDVTRSSVTPFIANPDAGRLVHVAVRNQGNVVEQNVTLRAELVQRIGLTKAEPIPLAGDGLEERTLTLARRTGTAEAEWRIREEDLLNLTTGEPILEPGGTYAIRVTVQPEGDSVKSWWHDESVNLVTTQDVTRLGTTDLVVLSDAREVLIPFLVEDSIIWHDFGETGGSLVPETFAYDQAWTAETRVDGELLAGEQRPWIPRWDVRPASEVGAEGQATGNAWVLPPYEGVEAVEQVLVSPPLPSHMVSATSQVILDLQLAHDLAEGQAVIESRNLVWDDEASEWVPRPGAAGDWRPVDSTRANRVAVVLAPDFPRVNGTWIEPSYPIHHIEDKDEDGETKRRTCQTYGDTRPVNRTEEAGNADPPVLMCYYDDREVPDHPWPPFYDGLNPVPCRENETSPGRPNYRCSWSPFPADRPEGDPEWREALNEMLNQLAHSLGAENVGVFTELNPDFQRDMDVVVDDPWPATLRVPDIEHTGNTFDFPINDLDYLGNHLDSYGAILLMGDNATTVFADRSHHLRLMAHNETHAYNVSRALDEDHEWMDFHKKVHEILRAADPVGVRVVGAIGPASGTLALSGAASDQRLTVWQKPGEVLENAGGPHGVFTFRDGQFRCTIDNQYETLTAERQNYSGPVSNINNQPKEMCEFGQNMIAHENKYNYYYFSPQDARSLALRDFLAQGGVERSNDRWESSRVEDGPLFVTARGQDDVEGWIDRVLEELGRTSGELGAGSGAWEPLPTNLAFSYAGSFTRGQDGEDRFVGNPSQFRIRIQADPDLGGHGFFALDRFGLLGTPPENDLSVRFVEPVDMKKYAPGTDFTIQFEVTNRGLNSSDGGLLADILVEETTEGCSERPANCTTRPFTTGKKVWTQSVLVPGLPPGGQTVIRLDGDQAFANGLFGDVENMENSFRFEVQLLGNADDNPFNDLAEVVAFGVRETNLQFVDLQVAPSAARHADRIDEGFDAIVQLANQGTQTELVRLQATLHAVRPIDCYDPDGLFDSGNFRGPYRACYPGPNQAFEPIPLNDPREYRFTIDRDETRDIAISVKDLDGIPPGIWQVVVRVERNDQEQGAWLTEDRLARWLNLADESVEPDGAWPAHRLDLREVSGPEQTVPTTPRHGDHGSREGDWHVPPEGHDIAVEGDALTVGGERHRGLYGPNQATRSGNTPLMHGWSLLEPDTNTIAPFDEPRLFWNRSSQRSVQQTQLCDDVTPGQRCNGQGSQRHGRDWNRQDVANQGEDDFGPDWVVWQPEYGPDGAPLSLASFEEPVLRLLTRYQFTENTGFVVQAQVPKRMCSTFTTTPGMGGSESECRWEWSWDGEDDEDEDPPPRGLHVWVPLEGEDTRGTEGLSTSPASCAGRPGDEDMRSCSRRLSNPLAHLPGLWGGQSESLHAQGDRWQIIEFDLAAMMMPGGALFEHCEDARDSINQVAATGLQPVPGYFTSEEVLDDSNPCRYAWSNGYWGESEGEKEGDPIPRPIRFRFMAASHGGDEGVNRLEIAGISLTDQKLHFENVERDVRMTDNAVQIVPFRLTNPSRATDEVTLSWAFPPGYHVEGGVDVSVGRKPIGTDFSDELTITVPPGRTVPVYVRLEVGLDHGFAPGFQIPLPVLVKAQSNQDPTAMALGLINGEFTTRPWADLEVRCLTLEQDDDCHQPFTASVDVPVSATVRWRNGGDLPIGSPEEPIMVRLMEERLDPATGSLISREVARDAEGEPAQRLWENMVRPFSQARSDEHVTMEWNPSAEGVYRIVAEINLPDEQDPVARLPESDYTTNRLERQVNVGPVQLSDLRVVDAWMEPFPATGERADRLIDGHWYRVNAHVTNQGQASARDFEIEFRFGAADPFSRGTRESFDGHHHQEVFQSSPWKARLPTDATNQWSFAVDVSTITPSATVGDKTLSWDVHVDSYSLRVADLPRNLTVYPNQEVHVPFNLTNTGNAPAIPQAWLPEPTTGVQVHLTGATRLEAGETAEHTLVIVTDNELTGNTTIPRVTVGVQEDPLLKVALPMDLVVGAEGMTQAAAHPFSATPGTARVEMGLVNPGNTPTTWRISNATSPLAVLPWSATVPAFGAERAEAVIQVQNGTLPGAYQAEMELEVVAASITRRFMIPVMVDVQPEPRFNARAEPDDQTVPLGRHGIVLLNIENPGNVPLNVSLNHTVDDGTLTLAEKTNGNLTLAPGQSRTQEVRVTNGPGALHVLGTSMANWTWIENGTQGTQNVTWRVAYEPSRVHIASTGLDTLKARPERLNEIPVTLENPMDRSVDAEVLLLVDGTVHTAHHVTLAPQGRTTVDLGFQAGIEGTGHDVMVIARPNGSTVSPTDAVFYEIADAESHHLIVDAEESGWRAIPGPSLLLLIAMLGVAMLEVIRRRRR